MMIKVKVVLTLFLFNVIWLGMLCGVTIWISGGFTKWAAGSSPTIIAAEWLSLALLMAIITVLIPNRWYGR